MITTWTQGDCDAGMAEALLVELRTRIERHPWWRARARLVLDLLRSRQIHPPARVLDAGCGWGVTLSALERKGYRAEGLDVARGALEQLDGPGRILIEADLTQPWPEVAVAGAYDAVLALDVVEHLDDDRAAVGRLAELVRPGGLVVVSVPALPELFSEFDAIQGHRRRYLPETLRSAFAGSGLKAPQILWWGSWMVPVLRRQRAKARGRHPELVASSRHTGATAARSEATDVAFADASGPSPTDVYRGYLALPPWPGPWALRLAFALDHHRTLRGRNGCGTSLVAVARRPA